MARGRWRAATLATALVTATEVPPAPLPAVADTATTGEFRVSNYADGFQEDNFLWRGYAFTVARNTTVTHLIGGGGSNCAAGFEGGLYQPSLNDSDQPVLDELLPGGITACPHTLQVTGTLTGGQQVSAELGVWVLANPFPYPDVAAVSTHAPAIGCLTDLDGIIGFDGGDYQQQQPTTRGQAATILVRLLGLDAADPSFGDAGTTHAGSIGALEAAGMLNGHTDGTVRPHAPLTRGQAASLLANAAGLDDDPDAAAGFADTGTTHAGALGALLATGGLTGFTDGTLRPDQPITRGQYATMVVRLRDLLQPDPDG